MVQVQINSYPINFELEGEKSVRDVVASVSQWARERNLIFVETEIDQERYDIDSIPELEIDKVSLINCFVQSKSDLVLNSIDEGILYCERVLDFLDDEDETRQELEGLSRGVDWLLELTQSVLMLLEIDPERARFMDGSMQDFIGSMATLLDSLKTDEKDVMYYLKKNRFLFEECRDLLRALFFSNEMKSLIVKSIDSPDILIESLREIRKGLPEQIEKIGNIVSSYQSGMDGEASELLTGFIDFLYRYVRTCHQLIPVFGIDISAVYVDGVSLEEKNGTIYAFLNDIVAAMENNDIISVTDILEYEIKPAFGNVDQYIDAVVSQISEKK